MALRDLRQWLAVVLGAAADRLQPRGQVLSTPEWTLCVQCVQGQPHQCILRRPALELVPDPVLRAPAICPTCDHTRGQHRVVEGGGRGPCLYASGCSCTAYAGPWPVHHLHVTTERCDTCGQSGGHWAWMDDAGQLQTVERYQDLPGETR